MGLTVAGLLFVDERRDEGECVVDMDNLPDSANLLVGDSISSLTGECVADLDNLADSDNLLVGDRISSFTGVFLVGSMIFTSL